VGYDDFTPEQVAEYTDQALRDTVGIDPGQSRPIVDLAALGLVNGVWRNSPVEDWHAGDGPLSDADMLRINSHTTWRVRRRLRGWLAATGLPADGPASDLDKISNDDVLGLARGLFHWFVNPRRKLPTGVTLAQVAGDLGEYEQHALDQLTNFLLQAEDHGVRFGLARAAVHGGLACTHWWGHPRWPVTVGRFMQVIDDPADEFWTRIEGYRERLPPEPALMADRASFHRTMLSRPWELDTESADWAILAGIGFLRPR
jgi:hypothetical protein